MANTTDVGKIGWIDITTADASGLKDFYAQVVGWRPEDVSMGDYNDFNMTQPASGEPLTGICHARGSNADIPPQWLIYITVADVTASAKSVVDLGGKLRVPVRPLAGGSFCVIEDPSGAVAALYQPPAGD